MATHENISILINSSGCIIVLQPPGVRWQCSFLQLNCSSEKPHNSSWVAPFASNSFILPHVHTASRETLHGSCCSWTGAEWGKVKRNFLLRMEFVLPGRIFIVPHSKQLMKRWLNETHIEGTYKPTEAPTWWWWVDSRTRWSLWSFPALMIQWFSQWCPQAQKPWTHQKQFVLEPGKCAKTAFYLEVHDEGRNLGLMEVQAWHEHAELPRT